MRSLDHTQALAQSGSEARESVAGLHRECFACGECEEGLGLVFESDSPDTVSGQWFCAQKYQSYPGIIHGGIIATIHDCAMTNCLLKKGISAVTADMHVQYREPVRVGDDLTVTATLTRSRSTLFMLSAEVTQKDRVKARASAKFMRTDVWSDNINV